jgi:hypothetical protein
MAIDHSNRHKAIALGHIHQKYFRQIVLGFVLLIGLITLARAINQMAH